MKIGHIVELEDVSVRGWGPVAEGIEYTDLSGARVFIPERLLIRLYEGMKYCYERNLPELSWDEHCDNLFKERA